MNNNHAAAFTGRTVLVTGAEGFIGSHLVELLVEAGAHVRAFTHYKPYAEKGFLAAFQADPRVTLLTGDIRDSGCVLDAVEGTSHVFHLAALIGIPYSYTAPEAYVQTNVTGTHNVLMACRRFQSKMIHTSTSEVYGTAQYAPIDEAHPLQPQSPYSASKIAADMLAMSYFNSFDTEVAICRPFNTYGPRQSARAIIPSVLQQLHGGAREIRLGSISPTRDFTYVTDTARGLMAIGASPETNGQTVNLGTGNEISIGALVEKLIEVSGSDARITIEEQRIRPARSEVHRLISDNTLVRQLTGWAPQVSLGEGLELTSAWIKDNVSGANTSTYAT